MDWLVDLVRNPFAFSVLAIAATMGLLSLLTKRPPQACLGALTYLALVPFVNWSFSWAPMFQISPDGATWTPLTIVTGLVLVFRDFAQREVGHWVFLLLAVALGLTYHTSGGALAFASGAAFLVSEIVDWAVYTFAKRPLSQRVLISSALGAPIDSAVFLFFASQIVPGIFNIWSVLASIAGKLFGAWIVSELIRRRERQANRQDETSKPPLAP